MTIEWTDSPDRVDWNELAALYRVAPLGDRDPADLQTVFANSRFLCFAYDAGALVGAGRALADGCDCSYLCDVAVLPSHQGTGLGKEIVTRLMRLSAGHAKIILYAAPGKEPFYRKLGFAHMTTAMAVFRDQGRALELGFIDD